MAARRGGEGDLRLLLSTLERFVLHFSSVAVEEEKGDDQHHNHPGDDERTQ